MKPAHHEGPKLIDRKSEMLISAPAWAVWLHRLRWVLALAVAVGCAALFAMVQRADVDSSNDSFIIKDDPAYFEFTQFSKKFTADNTVVVGIEFPSGLTAESAGRLTQIQKTLEALPEVERVAGLPAVQSHRLKWFGQMEEKPLLEPLSEGKKTPEEFLAGRGEWSPEAGHLLSADGHMAALVLFLRSDPARPDFFSAADTESLIARVREAAGSRLRPDEHLVLTGTAVEEHAFATQIDRDRRTFVPLCVGVIIALLVIFYLNLRTLVYGLAVMGGSLVIMDASMSLLHVKVQAVTALLAPVILIVAVSSTIKVTGIFEITRRGIGSAERLAESFAGMFVPCFLANLTTFIGFVSLLVSRIPAVREFGFFGALGTAAAWALTMLWAPLFHAWTQPARKDFLSKFVFEKIGWVLAWIARHAHWLLVAAAIAFTALCVQQIPRIQTSTELLKIFKPDDPFRADTEVFLNRMGGIYPLEVMVETPSLAAMRLPETWDRLDTFEGSLSNLPNASHALGVTDVVRYFERVAGRARSGSLLEKILTELPLKMGPDLRRMATEGYQKIRFTVFLYSTDTQKVTALVREIPRIAKEKLGDAWEVTVTGETRLLAEMSDRLVRDEMVSVVTAFGVILVLIILTIRSLPYALLGILPNVVPIAGLFGTMAYLKIGLNTATAMIASVAIGLIFDNTVYLLYGYREARARGMDADAAVTRTLSLRFRPMIVSSLILAGGFGVTMFGHMIPTVQFGLLSCVTIGLAAVSDLLVLPALLHIFKPR